MAQPIAKGLIFLCFGPCLVTQPFTKFMPIPSCKASIRTEGNKRWANELMGTRGDMRKGTELATQRDMNPKYMFILH